MSVVVLGLVGWRVLFIPAVYFRVAFFLIQRTSVMRDGMDWPAVRAEADVLRRDARTTADTYPAIRLVLQRLGDDHSHLVGPEAVRAQHSGASATPGLIVIWPERVVALVVPGGPADVSGVRVGDVVEAVNGREPAHNDTVVFLPGGPKAFELTLRRTGEAAPLTVRLTSRVVPVNRPATVRSLAGSLGYIEVPGVIGDGRGFGEEAAAAIRTVDAAPRCGWVVDLRRNLGGNMSPMMDAVRPVLGEATAGYFVPSEGRVAFSYRPGKGQGANAPAYRLKHADPPVAVLTSRLTVSSGEALTIAFRGRPGTRSFGEATQGLPTANEPFPLVDGARLVVTTAHEADRTGRVYKGRIPPDQDVEIDWTRIGSDDDPVLRAADTWLRNQPQCASAGPG